MSPHNKSQKSARRLSPAYLSSCARTADGLGPSLGPSATLIVHDQQQTWTDTALGRRWGMCRPALDVAQDWPLRRAGLQTSPKLTFRGRNTRIFLMADRSDCRRSVASFQSLRDSRLKCVAKANPCHSSAPSLCLKDPRAEGFGRVETPFAGQRNVFGS